MTHTDSALTDADLARLETLLDSLPAELQPLDVSALDGFLCGVLLQPRPVAPGRWLPLVCDLFMGITHAITVILLLVWLPFGKFFHVFQRPAQLGVALYQLEGAGPPSECVLPWVAGFAAALEAFPGLTALDDPELVEPLALVFMHFDPSDLEDAAALVAVIETLEPPTDLAEAVQDIVRALMLMADVTRPRVVARRPGPPRRAPAGKRRR